MPSTIFLYSRFEKKIKKKEKILSIVVDVYNFLYKMIINGIKWEIVGKSGRKVERTIRSYS